MSEKAADIKYLRDLRGFFPSLNFVLMGLKILTGFWSGCFH